MHFLAINAKRPLDNPNYSEPKRLKTDTPYPFGQLPEDLISEIFKRFAVGQLFERINGKDSPSLLHRICLVSKAWHNALVKVFCHTKIPLQMLLRLKENVAGNDVVKLAQFCQGNLSSLHLTDGSLATIYLTKVQWKQILPLITNIRKVALPLGIAPKFFSKIAQLTRLTTFAGYPGHYITPPEIWQTMKVINWSPNLTSFKIRGFFLDTSACANICQIPPFTNLTCLDMNKSKFHNGFTLLAEKTHLPHLKTLNLSGCELTNLDSLVHLVTPNLSRLDLSYNFFSHKQIVALSQSALASAETLKISIRGVKKDLFKGIEPRSIEAMLNGFTHLQHLSVASIQREGALGPEGAAALAYHPAATQLQTLHLESAFLDNEGLRSLLTSHYLTNVTDLNLANNRFGEVGISAFKYSNIPLRHLVLNSNEFDKEGKSMQSLTDARAAASLESLSLSYCMLSEYSLNVLANTSHFTCLNTLDLSRNYNFRIHSIFPMLAKNPYFMNLREIITEEKSIFRHDLIEFAKNESTHN